MAKKKERRSNTSVSVFICWSGDRSYEQAQASNAVNTDIVLAVRSMAGV